MNNPTQHWRRIFVIRRRVAGAALALAIMLVSAVLATGSAQAQTYSESVLHTFTGPPDGASPTGSALDAKGNLYGIAGGGDSACDPPYGCGTVFKVDASGTETVLYSFTGTGGDGADPFIGLTLDAQGNLYGTTWFGGDLACNAPEGCGTVFKFDTTTGNETVLYSFTGSPESSKPMGSLVLDAQGNLYGTAHLGGDLACNAGDGCGTVFELDTAGVMTVLYSFTGTGGDGALPGGLVQDAQGNLYGTTADGGDLACEAPEGCGTVYKLAPPVAPSVTWTETTLYSFSGGVDGADPWPGLVQDKQGNLYGTTSQGGDLACNAPDGCGTAFELDTTGRETVLYSFTGTGGDGAIPGVGLVRDAKGTLYGTTIAGGDLACNAPDGCGTAFELDTTGKETVQYSFTGTGGDGANPFSGLVRDAKGNLYGGTLTGGDLSCTTGPGGNGQTLAGCGTVFKLTPAKVTKTTTTLTSAPNPSTYGEAVTFTAVVTPAPPDGETVSFMKGKTVLGTGTLSGGTATFVTSTLKVGTTSVTAVYGGDSEFDGSKSKPVKQVVEKTEE